MVIKQRFYAFLYLKPGLLRQVNNDTAKGEGGCVERGLPPMGELKPEQRSCGNVAFNVCQVWAVIFFSSESWSLQK